MSETTNTGDLSAHPWKGLSNHAHKENQKIRVTLSCGHKVTRFIDPWPTETLACRAQRGCGYQLKWESYENSRGVVFPNRT